MSMKHLCLLLITLALAGCSVINLDPLATILAPPAETLAARGGQIAGTQSAKILQTAQAAFATQSDNLSETAKAQAATYAASLIDTAQANLVTDRKSVV